MPISAENTMVEFLTKMLRVCTDAKLAIDADLPFLIEIETTIISKLREPFEQAQQQGMLPPGAGGQPPMAQGPAPQEQGLPPELMQQMGSAQMSPLQGMPAGRGASPGPGAPNADELRRLLNG